MTSDTAIGLVELGVSLIRELTSHNEPDDNKIDDTLIEIVQTTARAYKQHTGEFLDPSLIHPEARID